jgi:hypothetical protein
VILRARAAGGAAVRPAGREHHGQREHRPAPFADRHRLGFVHVNETTRENGPSGLRFPVSPALVNVFLPHRQAVLQAFVGG